MKYWFIFLTLCLTILSCTLQDDPINDRQKRALKSKGPIIIGAVAPWSKYQNLWEGIELAVNQVNADGGILERQLKIIKKDDEGSITKGQKIAQSFADNLDMVAVIGHYNSHVSIPCSIIYEYSGLLMLCPYSSNPKLTQQGFKRIFRNTINDETFGREMANFCNLQNYKSILIYHAKNQYGTGFANAFEQHCEELDIIIKDRLSYDSFSTKREFHKNLEYWKEMYSFDAIFLAGTLPHAAEFVKAARSLDIQVPIVSGAGLDFEKFMEIAGDAAEQTFIGAVFHSTDPDRRIQTFVKQFQKAYGATPNNSSAQGYDSVMVLTHAIKKAGTTDPEAIGNALRSLKKWDGVLKKSSFDQNGDIIDTAVTIKVVKNGRFEFFKTITFSDKQDK